MTLRDFFNSLIDTPISEFFIFIVIFGLGIVFFNFCTETLEKYLKNETWTHLIVWFVLIFFIGSITIGIMRFLLWLIS